MDNRELIKVIVSIAVAAIVVAAVLAAGYILVTELMGNPGPSPTAGPAIKPTPTPLSSIPSGPFNPTGTPSYPAVPTAVRPVVKSAELAGYGTDKDAYNRGDTAIAYIIIKNTGTATINDAQLKIKVERYVSVVGYVNLQDSTQPLTDLGIQPGETKKVEYKITIPSDYQGMSTAGKYRFTIHVIVWDKDIGSFQKEVEVK